MPALFCSLGHSTKAVSRWHVCCVVGSRQICDCTRAYGRAAAVSRWEVAPCQVPAASPQSVVMRKVPRAPSGESLSLWNMEHFTGFLSAIFTTGPQRRHDATWPSRFPGNSWGRIVSEEKGYKPGTCASPILQIEKGQKGVSDWPHS